MRKIILLISVFFGTVQLIAQQTADKGDSILHSLKTALSVNPARDTFALKNNTPQLSDPKLAFKNLFVTDTKVSGINTAQLNPLAVSFVQDYMEKHGKHLEKMKSWGRPYFDMMDIILTQHGLPKELKYLAVIESYLKTYAVSWAGAVGPWQFMPATARSLGLRVNNYVDERTDYFKSTHAAARYLTRLNVIYNDWLLVIAAYNGGPGNVDKAIRLSKSRDFWTLQNYLPAESRDHVKKFIATHYIMEGGGSITTLTNEETKDLAMTALRNPAIKNLTEEEIKNSKMQSIGGKYNSLVIAKHTLFSITEFNRYNPGFDKQLADSGKYELRLPADKMDLFTAKRNDILRESIQIMLEELNKLSPATKPEPVKN